MNQYSNTTSDHFTNVKYKVGHDKYWNKTLRTHINRCGNLLVLHGTVSRSQSAK